MSLLFLAYDTLAAFAVGLLLVPFSLARVVTRRDSSVLLKQRLGAADPGERHVVIHGASVGEIRASEALVSELEESDRDVSIVLSTTNASGLEAAKQIATRHRSVIACRMLPWDSRAIVMRWLRRSRPCAVIVVETELWPNLFRCCGALGIPVAVASGRIYRSDLGRYVKMRAFFGRVLSNASLIGAQSLEEALRFRAIGAACGSVAVLGNLKSSLVAWSDRGIASDRPVIVAGCTHRGEEELVVDACRVIAKSFPELRLVIAPRHVERAGEARSAAARAPELDVRVVDRVGELGDLYRAADVAFIGGSLLKNGGHNPLEALATGCPVVTGPHLENVEAMVAPFRDTPCLTVVEDATSLEYAIRRYLTMGEADRNAMSSQIRLRLSTLTRSCSVYAKWVGDRADPHRPRTSGLSAHD